MTQTVEDQERRIIEVLVKQALEKLFANDRFLLEIDANERTITHKLAEYLQDIFVNWHVDCEYNRYYQESEYLQKKIILPHKRKKVDVTDLKATTVYPDIIVHGRGTKFNLIVIEVKKSTLKSTQSMNFDILKLRQYKKGFNYKYAFFLILYCGEDLPQNATKYEIKWVDD